MKRYTYLILLILTATLYAQDPKIISSPDGALNVEVSIIEGKVVYSVVYANEKVLSDSPLNLITNEGDFSSNVTFVGSEIGQENKTYEQKKIKQSKISYTANTLKYTVQNAEGNPISILFQVSDNDIAFRYEIPVWGETMAIVIEKEETGFKFPSNTTAFLSAMMEPMTGFARTAPSYENGYNVDKPVESQNASEGYIFPGLFHVANTTWVLISETGVRSNYPGAHLSKYEDGGFSIEFPNPKQNNGFGSSGAQLGLPGVTPWRTITVGESLAPIIETTIPWDVVDPLYEPSQDYKFGRGTWSWIIWQDGSMNYEDQIAYIDLASEMGYEYILIDAWWDTRIGYDKMEQLIKYANSKGVDVFLWYNSNGSVNDAFMTPRNKMNTAIERKKEMKWLKEAGVKGLKVDFFGGDKQDTMRLYENILSDANDYGLMIIFHGTTLPRGWERMYPNFVGSEAVVASEMLVFVEDVRKQEAYNASIHPFIRNSVASMEFGGVILNDYLNKGNTEGQKRLTTDAFQLATGILFQNPIQMFALTPNNLDDVPEFEVDFMKKIPTTWDETKFIEGYPGKYCVLARRNGEDWYLAGINAEKQPIDVQLDLTMFSKQSVSIFNDSSNKETFTKELKVSKNGKVTITIQPNGGFVITK